ncbi:MAG: hypothetical protein ACKO9I_03160, partial [Sphaerospermopsis kisseleviana]
LFRLISGALKSYGTVIVCEAKGGVNGTKDGAAFTDLANFLQQKWPDIQFYRWPRGNCYYNPLENLSDPEFRRDFFSMLGQVVIDKHSLDGETAAVVYNAASISEQLFLLQQMLVPDRIPTLRDLVGHLSSPDAVKRMLEESRRELPNDNSYSYRPNDELLLSIEQKLTMMNFFFLGHAQLVLTRRGVQLFKDILDHEDLLSYTEPIPNAIKLDLQSIIQQRSLVILSQPISKQSSTIVGPLFLDNLLYLILQSGPYTCQQENQKREKVLAILDETHRLPVGFLGQAGDFLREYNVGLVEVAPTIPENQKRWDQNKHVYQTLLSLSPGIPTLTKLMHDRLPNLSVNPVVSRLIHSQSGVSRIRAERRGDYEFALAIDNPGVASRSLQVSGKFTGLLQSSLLQSDRKLFWIDFEDEALANIKGLLKKALSQGASSKDKNIVDYALGLDELKYDKLSSNLC